MEKNKPLPGDNDNKNKFTDILKKFALTSLQSAGKYLQAAVLNFFKQLFIWTGILIAAIILIYIIFKTPAFSGLLKFTKESMGLSGSDTATSAAAVATMLIIGIVAAFSVVNFIKERLKSEYKQYKDNSFDYKKTSEDGRKDKT